MKPKLSVIIPVYNVEKYIRQCLDSVYQQTFRDFEVIIIDDGSPDNCGAICDEYERRYNDTVSTTVVHKENEGLTHAWSDGLKLARGQWITFVDSDDWLETNYFESMFHALGNQPADIFCAGGCFKNRGEEQATFFCFDTPRLYATREERDYMMTRVLVGEKRKCAGGTVSLGSPQAMWDKFYRAEFIRQRDLQFELSMSAIVDVLFNLIAFDQADCIGVSTVCGYHYRQVENSDTRRFNPKRRASFVAFFGIVNNYLVRHGSNPNIKKALNAYAVSILVGSLGTYFCHPDNTSPYRHVAKEFVQYKKTPCFADAIWERKNPYITFKRRVWVFSLRLPGFTPVKFLYTLSARRRRKKII